MWKTKLFHEIIDRTHQSYWTWWKKNSEIQQQQHNIKCEILPKVTFYEAEKEKIEVKIKALFGELRVFSSKSEIDDKGVHMNDDEFLCEDFTQLQQYKWENDMELDIEAQWLKGGTCANFMTELE